MATITKYETRVRREGVALTGRFAGTHPMEVHRHDSKAAAKAYVQTNAAFFGGGSEVFIVEVKERGLEAYTVDKVVTHNVRRKKTARSVKQA